ncbi:MAG TPA: aldolase/citrate lyase family protein [Methanomicrobiales archaeon]|jgi:2-dehydro-3-deoxyglucarate aldolase|nr:aldolase/citrate lyase family protein [Methanomicrobiales archaeon]
MTSLKERLHGKEVTFGSWITLGHPAIGEILAGCGFDWLTIDMEHSAITLAGCQGLVQVIELAGCSPLVRVGENAPNLIKRVMDAGAHGVIVPQVNSREDALRAVASVKYPPEGARGVGLGRAQGYGVGFDAYRKWNDEESIVIVQVEHIEAVRHLGEILKVPGVDGFIVGPYDLSASLGHPGEFTRPEFLEAMNQIHLLMKQVPGVAPGFHVVQPDPGDVAKKIREGYRFIGYSLDSLLLADTCRRDLATVSGGRIRPRRFIKETGG